MSELLFALFLIFVGLGWTWHKYRVLWRRDVEPEFVSPDAAVTSYALGGTHQDAALSAIFVGVFGWILAPLTLLAGIVYLIYAIGVLLGIVPPA